MSINVVGAAGGSGPNAGAVGGKLWREWLLLVQQSHVMSPDILIGLPEQLDMSQITYVPSLFYIREIFKVFKALFMGDKGV